MQIQPCKPDPAQFLELSITSTVLVVGLASKASAVHAHDHWLYPRYQPALHLQLQYEYRGFSSGLLCVIRTVSGDSCGGRLTVDEATNIGLCSCGRAPPPEQLMRAPLHRQCGITMALLRYVQHKNAIPRWNLSPLHLAMEKRWLVSTAYFCLGLLCSGVGQTPDNNEGKILCVLGEIIWACTVKTVAL